MASNMNLFCFLFIHLLIFLSPTPSIAKVNKPFKPRALVLPVTKDSKTLQYIIQTNQRTPLVPIKLTLDVGGEFLWMDCDKGYVSSSYKPALCGSFQCNISRSFACGDCFNGPMPGCNNNTCSLLPGNPIKPISTMGEVAQDVVSVLSTDGSNPGRVVLVPQFLFVCGSTFLLEGLASGVKGIFGLGRTKIAPPSQLASAFNFPRKFAICLSSYPGSKGVIFFGDSPYHFLPCPEDFSKELAYTPLIKNPVSTAGASFASEPSSEYFIGVTGIQINEKPVTLNATLLKINKEGYGGTKITTINPYTTLERSIYKAVTRAFVKSFAKVPRVKAVAPFEICCNSKSLGSTRVGPGVPPIDFMLQNGTIWSFFGANTLVQINENVLCLGFVDGGVEPRTSIVIGGHQIEDNLLQIDISNSRLGFSSSLLFRQTTCANFNFTSKA